MLPDAKDALTTHESKVFLNAVVYSLIDDYQKWVEEKRKAELEKRSLVAFPGKIGFFPTACSGPKQAGHRRVRVLAGRIRSNQAHLRRRQGDPGAYAPCAPGRTC